MTLARLNRILDVLGTDLFELARIARRERTLPRELSLQQEAALAKDARLSVGIALVCRPWTFSATAALRRS